jgi:Asp-tRNA(Asn)/Glu-tRNA(Gln) amidotransferase A subunit family amidase
MDVMAGYDPEDPLTAMGFGRVHGSYMRSLDPNGLRGARIGILRESIGFDSEPASEDFAKVNAVFDRAVRELEAAGAVLVDPVVIPDLKPLLAKRAPDLSEMEESFKVYFGRNPKSNAPFKDLQEMVNSPEFENVVRYAQRRLRPATNDAARYRYLAARDGLMINFLKVMAENQLDAIVHKTVEHQPTLIKDGVGPPWENTKGVPWLNTFLMFVPALTVPAGFTSDNLPVGITFQGRAYDEPLLIKLAYSYEQGTRHRKPPDTAPCLADEP